jgi:hypothetical protein
MSELNNCCGTTCDKQAAIAERDALVAQVELLRRHRRELLDLIYNNAIGQVAMSYSIDGEAMAKHAFSITGIDAASTAKESTPAQCLSEIQAEAGRAGFVAGADSYFDRHYDKSVSDEVLLSADKYAEHIRQGTKQ